MLRRGRNDIGFRDVYRRGQGVWPFAEITGIFRGAAAPL